MSIDHPTLADYCDTPDPAPGQDAADTAAWTPTDPHCRQCAAADVADPSIEPAVARVVGDNEGCVDRCERCTEGVHSTVAAARLARTGGLRVAPAGRRGGAVR